MIVGKKRKMVHDDVCEKRMKLEVEKIDFSPFDKIKFYENEHYYEDPTGRRMPLSATKIPELQKPFPRNMVLNNIARNLLAGKECGGILPSELANNATQDEAIKYIDSVWKARAQMGTDAHKIAEDYINSGCLVEYTDEKFQKEFEYIKKFLSDQKALGFMPIKTELRVCDPEMCTIFHDENEPGVAGSVDLILYNEKTGECKVCDWKRTNPKYDSVQKWQMQLGIYHIILKKYIKGYNPIACIIMRIYPDNYKLFEFSPEECLKATECVFSPVYVKKK